MPNPVATASQIVCDCLRRDLLNLALRLSRVLDERRNDYLLTRSVEAAQALYNASDWSRRAELMADMHPGGYWSYLSALQVAVEQLERGQIVRML